MEQRGGEVATGRGRRSRSVAAGWDGIRVRNLRSRWVAGFMFEEF